MRIPDSRHEPPHRRRRLYRSLGGRLETTKAQRDTLHQFSNINAPFALLYARNGILLSTRYAVLRECNRDGI